MPQRCIIPDCFGEPNRSVFRVPKDFGRRHKWLKAVRDMCPNLYVNENFRVCEKHFRKSDFTSFIADKSGKIVQEVTVARKRLKQGAVPHFDVLNLDSGHDSTKTILAEQDNLRFQPQRHLEYGLHTLDKEEIEEDSAALHDDVQFKPLRPDRERERVPNMQTAIIKTEIEVEPAALHDDLQVNHQRPDREREFAFNMQTAIKSQTEEDSATLPDDKQVKHQHPDHKREIALNMPKAIKTEKEEESTALHYDAVQVKHMRLHHEKVRALNMQTSIKSEIEEDSTDLHCDMQSKHEHPGCETEIALNMQIEIKSEIEEDFVSIYDDVQVKHMHLHLEKVRALNMQTSLKSEIEEDSAALHCDMQFKHEHPDREREIPLNMPTTIKSEIEDSAGIYDSVQVKYERPHNTTRLVLQSPGPSTEQLFTDIKRKCLNKAAVPSIFPWNQFALPIKCEFSTFEDLNSLSYSGPETKNVHPIVHPMVPLIGFASYATSVTETQSTAASDSETDYDVVVPFNASGIKKTYSKQGAPLPKRPRLKRNNETLKQEKTPEKENDDTVTEENVSEALTAEANVQSTESAEDKQLPAEYKAFTCNDCRKQFKSKRMLVQHIKIHIKNISELYFNCTECEYNTVTQDALDKHLKFHDKKRRHVCETCSFRFNRKDVLQTHIKHCHTVNKKLKSVISNKVKTCSDFGKNLSYHSEEKPFPCPHCPYKYTQQSHLKRHMRTHTGEKRFSCPQCPYKCALQCVLKNHIRTHTGEKPLSCPLCQFKCIQQCDLKNHMRTHTGEKPFSCPQCQYKCTKRSNLKRHILSNHRKV